MMDHIISADESETEEIQMKTMDWSGDLTELVSRANTQVNHQVIQGRRAKYNMEFDFMSSW
jgi:hypothetical protein